MSYLLNYLYSCFDSTFNNYRKEEIYSLESYTNLVIQQTLFDANLKCKGKSIIESEEELIKLAQIEPAIEAVLLYRLERAIFINDSSHPILPYIASLMRRRTGLEIYYSTEIGKGLIVMHGFGIVIGPRYKIGEYFTIYQGVTLGQRNKNSPNEKITIGDNVTIFAGTIVLGTLNIGDKTIIGANSVLLTDTEQNSVYVGVPAKRIK